MNPSSTVLISSPSTRLGFMSVSSGRSESTRASIGQRTRRCQARRRPPATGIGSTNAGPLGENACMAIPDVLALDFDGVLCDGMLEYFETSRRTYAKVWPGEPEPGDESLPAFRRLRPVIMTGWEMPLLLRAIVTKRPEDAIAERWPEVRDALVAAERLHEGGRLEALAHTLDDVRRDWIDADRRGWLAQNVPYCTLGELRSLVAEPD